MPVRKPKVSSWRNNHTPFNCRNCGKPLMRNDRLCKKCERTERRDKQKAR